MARQIGALFSSMHDTGIRPMIIGKGLLRGTSLVALRLRTLHGLTRAPSLIPGTTRTRCAIWVLKDTGQNQAAVVPVSDGLNALKVLEKGRSASAGFGGIISWEVWCYP